MREFCPFRTIDWILWHKAFESPNEDERDLNFHFSKGSLYKVLWESFPSLAYLFLMQILCVKYQLYCSYVHGEGFS